MENVGSKDSLRKANFISIIILAIVIRIWGISFDLPHIYHVDEARFAKISINYFSGDLNPHFFHVPTLHTYAVAGIWGAYYLIGKVFGKFHSLNEFMNSYYEDSTIFLVLGRMFTVFLSLGTLLLVYFIGKRLYNQWVGLIASLFLIFSPIHNKISHYFVPDIPMVFFQIVSFFFIWLIYKKGKTEYYILAGLFAGLAMGTKYGGLLLFFPLFLAHVFRIVENRQPVRDIFLNFKLVLAGVFFLAGFFMGCPYALVDFRSFWRGFRWQSKHLFTIGHLGTSLAQPSWLFYLKYGFAENIGKYTQYLALGGIIYSLFRHQKREMLLISFPLVQFLIMSQWKTHAVRYLLPLTPFIVLIAANFLYLSLSKIGFYLSKFNSKFSFVLRKRGIFVSIIVILFLLSPGMKVLKFDYSLTQKDTRTIAKEWIDKNIPNGSRIAMESYCPPISRRKYKVIYRHTLGQVDLEWLSQRRRNFIIISDIMYARFTRFPDEFPKHSKFYNSLDENTVFIRSFKPKWDDYLIDLHNPTIRIYRLSNLPNFSFPGNFNQYSQRVTLTKSGKKKWILQSTFNGRGLIRGNERVKNPYVRIVDFSGKQIAKLTVYEGEIKSFNNSIYSNLVEISSLPTQSRIYVGYEYEFYPSPLNYILEGPLKKEYCLTEKIEQQALLKKKLQYIFLFTSFPNKRGDDYYQIVTLSKSRGYWALYSRIFGGELRWGNDYVLNPFVQIFDSEGNEITKLIIFKGRVGSQEAKRKGPVMKSKLIPFLPDDYRVYVGYDSYCDFKHLDQVGGPEKFEIFSSNSNH